MIDSASKEFRIIDMMLIMEFNIWNETAVSITDVDIRCWY